MESFRACLRGRRLLLGLDYDGTLVEIAPRPGLARASPELLDLLSRLAAHSDYAVVVVTGRPLKDLQKLLPVPGLNYICSHGGEARMGSETRDSRRSWFRNELQSLRRGLAAALNGLDGCWLEDKPLGVALHYRQASPPEEARILSTLDSWLENEKRLGPFQVLKGKKVVELLSGEISKAAGFLGLWKSPRFSHYFPAYIGDDTTDESVFLALRDLGFTIKVGDSGDNTAARYFLSNPREVREFLALMAGERRTPG